MDTFRDKSLSKLYTLKDKSGKEIAKNTYEKMAGFTNLNLKN